VMNLIGSGFTTAGYIQGAQRWAYADFTADLRWQ